MVKQTKCREIPVQDLVLLQRTWTRHRGRKTCPWQLFNLTLLTECAVPCSFIAMWFLWLPRSVIHRVHHLQRTFIHHLQKFIDGAKVAKLT